MTDPSVTLEQLRSGDPQARRRYFALLVNMARRCVPPEVDAESVAHEAMAEVLSWIAANKQPLGLRMWARMAVSQAARRATRQTASATTVVVTPEMLRRGEPEAIERFFVQLVRMARRYVSNKLESESVAREAMTEVLARLDRDEEPVELEVWARTAVGRAARKSINLYKRAPRSFLSVIHSPAEQQPSGSDIQHASDQLQRVHGIIQSLPMMTQQAIVATVVDGRTIESVAAELGVPASTLRSRLNRARGRIEQDLASVDRIEHLSKLGRQIRGVVRRAASDDSSSIRS